MTGEGTEIDVSAIEAGINLVGPVLLDVSVNGHSAVRPDYPTGNRLEWPNAAPHGVYPALGEDRWVAIAVFDDAQWAGSSGPRRPEWTDDERFATQDARHANQDVLDEHVAAWTRGARPPRGRRAAAGRRRAGRRGAERRGPQRDRPADRPPWRVLRDGPSGDRPARFEGNPFLLSTAPDNWRSAPLLGEDNDYVFKQIVGIDDDEFDAPAGEGL